MRISDWSSDVCSSDLQQHLHRTGRAVWQRQLVHFTESQLLELGCGFLARRQHTATYLARCSRSLLQNRSTVVNNVIRSRSGRRSEEHTSELQSLMRISYAVFCLKKKKNNKKEYDILHTKTKIIKDKQ